jgi:uncharacterized DUF497 family protein
MLVTEFKAMAYNFSYEKNIELIQTRNISFDEAIQAIRDDKLIEVIDHPNQTKYKGQLIAILEMYNYVYLMPFVIESNGTAFLKTIFPSREYTKTYIKSIN